MSQIAKNTVYWPGIDVDIEDLVNRCPACLVTKPNNKREPLLPHTVPEGPWQKVGADYFDFDGKKFLLVIITSASSCMLKKCEHQQQSLQLTN